MVQPSGPTLTLTVAVLAEKRLGDASRLLLLQRRRNPADFPSLRGVWELPQGKVPFGMLPAEAAMEELRKEAAVAEVTIPSGSRQIRIHDSSGWTSYIETSPALIWHGVHAQILIPVRLVVPVETEARDTEEAFDHRWVTVRQLADLIASDDWLPSARPIAHYWLSELSQLTAADRAYMQQLGVRRRPQKVGLPTVCVDVGGVLLEPTTRRLTRDIARLFALPSPEVTRLVMAPAALADDMNRGDATPVEVLNRLGSVSGKRIPLDEFSTLWCSSLMARSANIRVIARLASELPELQWMYTTNVDPLKHAELTTQHPWYSALDACIASFEHRLAKPNPEYFRLVSELAHCGIAELFLIDDKEENLTSAATLGMGTYAADQRRPLDYADLRRAIENWIGEL